MELKFRDFEPNLKQMRYFDLDTYDKNEHDAYGNIMRFIGLQDKNKKNIFEKDILKFPYLDEGGFANSNAGQKMKEKSVDSLIILFNQSEFLSVDFNIYFMKGDRILTNAEWYGYTEKDISEMSDYDSKETMKPYYQHDITLHFIKYLVNKNNLEIIGNTYETPDLIK